MNKKIMDLFYLVVLTVASFFITSSVYADDYPDDIYDGDYSLKEMLENYNVVSFGKKELDNRMLFYNFSKGDVNLYHINSRFLVNGNLDAYRLDLRNNNNSFKAYAKNIRLIKVSHIACGYNETGCFIDDSNRSNPTSELYSNNNYLSINGIRPTIGNYINFDRLYDSIVSEQNKIKKGKYVTLDNKDAYIETGGEYYIDDINEIDNIIFENFSENRDKLTIITINNNDNIKFPKIYEAIANRQKNIIPTNDFFGMTRPNSDYAQYYVIDKYYGNIIWNIPNASYIELSNTPFVGHLVAPKADVYGREFHFAGTFLINSLYVDGNSEAHYYPLTTTNIPYRATEKYYEAKTTIEKKMGKIKFNNRINNEELEEGMFVSFTIEPENNYTLTDLKIEDANKNIITFRKVGNNEYEFTMPASNVTITPIFKDENSPSKSKSDDSNNKETSINPKTIDSSTFNFVTFLSSLLLIGVVLAIYLRKKNKSTKI